MRRSLIVAAALLCALGATGTTAQGLQIGHPAIGAWGLDLAGMDTRVRPGDDFYLYANGTWQKNAVIPADRPSVGAFQNLRVRSEDQLKAIAADLDARPYDQLTVEEKKLRDLYDAFIDGDQIEARGLDPVEERPHLSLGASDLRRCRARHGVDPARDRERVRRRHRLRSGELRRLCDHTPPKRARHAGPRLLSARRRGHRGGAPGLQEILD